MKGTLREDRYTFWIIPLSVILRVSSVSDHSCRESRNRHFMFNNLFSKIVPFLWDNVEKYCTAAQATDDNMAHAHCMLDT